MQKTSSIVIIGGGVIGCALAYQLARRGVKDIVVLEKEYLTSGATGRCGAGVRQQWATETNCLLAKESVRMFENMNEELGYSKDIEFKQKGYLLLAYTDDQWNQFKKNVKLQKSLGIPVEMVKPQKAKEIVPHLNIEGLIGATYCGTDGHANPFHVTYAYAEAARKLGVKIETYTEVIGFEVEKGKIKKVKTNRGDIYAPIVVNCAGPHSGEIAKMAGEEIPIYPERHQALVTEPVESIQDPMVISFHHHIYCQQVPHGSFVMGMGDPNEPTSFNQKSSWQFLEEMAQKVVSILPPLKDIRVVRQWAGLYDMSPDANPVIDELASVKGFYTVAGFSGHGFMVAPITGVMVAQLILGEETSLPVHPFGLERFKRGEYLLEHSVV
ncbi:MAG: FAD-dependent oxidoreductase [Peptococcaceae bacterium BICA1-8]|nr:MAG: FAD-dependent oxidoreductase [Peptococcaceae bacterium BICA1-8]